MEQRVPRAAQAVQLRCRRGTSSTTMQQGESVDLVAVVVAPVAAPCISLGELCTHAAGGCQRISYRGPSVETTRTISIACTHM